MQETQLNAILVGCGGFARNYLGVYRKLSFVRPVLCFDVDEATAAGMAKSIEGASYTTDFERVKQTEADLAVVSTPNFKHLEHGTELLRSGKNVLIQKPLARSFQEAEELCVAAKSAGKTLGLYMSMLDYDLWWELREALRQKRVLGDVVEINLRIGHTGGLVWRPTDASNWRFSKEKTGGGVFVMLGVHYLHLISWLTGQTFSQVRARTANRHCPLIEGEDICHIQAELADGSLCLMSMAWNSTGEHFSVYGTKGSFVYLDNQLLRVQSSEEWKCSNFIYRNKGAWQTYLNLTPPAMDDTNNRFNQHRQFAEAVRDHACPAVGGADGLCDMAVVDAVYRSASSGGWEPVAYGAKL